MRGAGWAILTVTKCDTTCIPLCVRWHANRKFVSHLNRLQTLCSASQEGTVVAVLTPSTYVCMYVCVYVCIYAYVCIRTYLLMISS